MKVNNSTTAELGSVVHIKSGSDDRSVLLVEPSNVDPFTNRISVESPLGQALMHKRENDLVTVKGPRSQQLYVIEEILPSNMWKKYIW